MTTKPTIEAAKSTGSVLTASEWNTNCLQAANYTFEVLAGTNSDKIPGSALATVLSLNAGGYINQGNGATGDPSASAYGAGARLVLFAGGNDQASYGIGVSSGGGGNMWFCVPAGTGQYFQFLFAGGSPTTIKSTGLTTGAVAMAGALTGVTTLNMSSGITSTAAWPSGQTLLTSGNKTGSGATGFVSGITTPAAWWQINLNGGTYFVPCFT